ncbi:MAG: methyltransferase domain-containing protein [Candidatus Hydrogenedentota bacterium]
MSNGYMSKARVAVLADVKGDIFEVGFGTGLNLLHYPESVKRITTADVNPSMGKIAKRRIDASPIEVNHDVLNAEVLPYEDASFDTVVCTWTLCSIPDVGAALSEMHRILRPGGRFHFVEHGLADDLKVRAWQHRLTPLQKRIGDGCRLNRDMKELIGDHHFSYDRLEMFYLPKSPRFAGFMYQGVASKV